MLKVLVIFHLYYKEQLDYFLGKLGNVTDCDWDLLVTGPDFDEDSKGKILSFKPDASFLKTANVGFDLWPFIAAVKSVDLDKYDILIKIHTKNSNAVVNRINGLRLKNYRWRDILVDSMFCSKEVFRKVMGCFDDASVGFVCSRSLYKDVSVGLAEDLGPLDRELGRLGVPSRDKHFCAGTMFAARTSPYRLLQTDLVTQDMFAPGESHSKGSVGHVYERIVSILPIAAGFKAGTISLNRRRDFKVALHKCLSPCLAWIFSMSRKGEKGHKYLTIFGVDIKIKD